MAKRKPKEEWADIPGYEGLYRISTYGRIIAKPRKRTYVDKDGNEKVRYYEHRFIEPKSDKNEYKHVSLCDAQENSKRFPIHRLVAMVFIPNPDNLPVVNHKDENPGNNRADNLEWCTNEYNIAYGTAPARHGKTLSENYRKKAIAEDEARMARLIERRGQNIHTGEWLYGDLEYNRVKEIARIHSYDDDGNYIGQNIVDSSTVGQFTGLLDKNGKEIYEGDIVRYYDDIEDELVNSHVIYHKDSCSFCAAPTELCGDYTGICAHWQFEVIGNIFDNSGLLSKKQ